MSVRASSPLRNRQRLAAVHSSGLLDTPADEDFDRLARLAAHTLRAPFAAITIVDDHRQFFKSAVGLPEPFRSLREVPLSYSFCKYVVSSGRPLVVEDARKHRWLRTSPAIQELGMVAYAGVPLRSASGHTLGSFCLSDSVPRVWRDEELRALEDFSKLAGSDIDRPASHRPPPPEDPSAARKVIEDLLSTTARFNTLVEQSIVGISIIQNRRIRYANPTFARMFGYSEEDLLALPSVLELVVEEDRAKVARNLRKKTEGGVSSLRYGFRGIRQDGKIIHVEVHGALAQIDGAPAVVGVLLDVTERAEAEKAVRSSELRTRRLLDLAHDAFVAVDEDGIITDWNVQAERTFGWSQEEAVGLALVETILPKDYQQEHERRINQFLETEQGDNLHPRFEIMARRKDGDTVPVELTVAPIKLGDSYTFSFFLHDITERTEIQGALVRSEERFQLIARATNDVLWEWDIASGGVTWSEAASKVFRCAHAELGPSIEWWVSRIHPGDRDRVVRDLDHVVHGAADVWSCEYRFLQGDGACAVMLDRGCVVREANGGPLRVIISMMDVTERRRAEDAQRLLAQARALLESSLDPGTTLPTVARSVIPTLADYCLIDVLEDGHLRRVAAAHAVPAKEALLRREEAQPLNVAAERNPVAKVVRDREPILVPKATAPILDAECRNDWKRLGTCSLMIVPLVVHEEVLGVITLGTAESRRHYSPLDLLVGEELARSIALALTNARLFRREQEAVHAREHLLGVVSHDLRNPLYTIQISTQLLYDQQKELEVENVKWLDVIQRSVKQMEHMIEDLLDLSSIDAGQLSMQLADYDVRSLMGEVRESFQPLATRKSLEFRCDPGVDRSTVHIDSHRIFRVFSNLMGNALKFTPEGGTITLQAERQDDEICFAVRDTGPGIPAEQLPHVFDRYWQARKGDRRGAGLGLSIVRGIVEAHGGRIWVESAPGQGTTFFFTVPTVTG